jgi:hypothetical protein
VDEKPCIPPLNGEKLTFVYVDEFFKKFKGGVIMHHEQLERGPIGSSRTFALSVMVTTFWFSPRF